MYPKLKPEAKALFIKLLGDKGQCRGATNRQEGDETTYCASGVLGLVIKELTGQGKFTEGGGVFQIRSNDKVGFPITITALNKVLVEPWKGGYNGYGDSNYLPFRLLEMNDHEKKTFRQIKKWVKENL